VLQGNCFPADLTFPYAPLLDLLRSFFAHPVPSSIQVDRDTLARDLFPLLPELVSDPKIPALPLEPEQEKRRLFAVMANFFIRLSTQCPVLLIIEDIHWGDDTSLDFLHFLARHALSQRILLLVTYRHDEVRSAAGSWLAQLDRQRLAQEIRLVHFSRSDVDAMLSAIFDQRRMAIDMRRFVHGDLLDTIFTLTEGNPFFVEETLTSLIVAGDIFYADGYWKRTAFGGIHIPRSVHDAVQRRTEHLSEQCARASLTSKERTIS
jgi:predicted ATPase